MSKAKVTVKGLPVFYSGKRYENGEELIIEKDHYNDGLFNLVEELKDGDDNPFKGVKETTLRKALEDNEIDIPDDTDRDGIIALLVANNITLDK